MKWSFSTRKVSAAGYVGLLDILTKAADKCGYAIALHGSLSRDMDVIAIPWKEKVTTPDKLVEVLSDAIGVSVDNISEWRAKPHGRASKVIHLGDGAYIDLSITPQSKWSVDVESVNPLSRSSHTSASYQERAAYLAMSASS